MEKLELIIVHGSMFSIHNSQFVLVLASLTICAILLVLVSAVFLAKRHIYLQSLNMQVQYSDRGLCSPPCCVLTTQSEGEKGGRSRSICAQRGSHIVYIGHVPHAKLPIPLYRVSAMAEIANIIANM